MNTAGDILHETCKIPNSNTILTDSMFLINLEFIADIFVERMIKDNISRNIASKSKHFFD